MMTPEQIAAMRADIRRDIDRLNRSHDFEDEVARKDGVISASWRLITDMEATIIAQAAEIERLNPQALLAAMNAAISQNPDIAARLVRDLGEIATGWDDRLSQAVAELFERATGLYPYETHLLEGENRRLKAEIERIKPGISWRDGPPPVEWRDGRQVLVWDEFLGNSIVLWWDAKAGSWTDGLWYADESRITHHAAITKPGETG